MYQRGNPVITLSVLALLVLAGCTASPSVQSTKSNAWCVKGTVYSEQAIQSTIEGIAVYKGREYCKASAELRTEGQSLQYTYYFDQAGSDVWVLVTQNGETTESHLRR